MKVSSVTLMLAATVSIAVAGHDHHHHRGALLKRVLREIDADASQDINRSSARNAQTLVILQPAAKIAPGAADVVFASATEVAEDGSENDMLKSQEQGIDSLPIDTRADNANSITDLVTTDEKQTSLASVERKDSTHVKTHARLFRGSLKRRQDPSSCPFTNGSSHQSLSNAPYQLLCNIDFFGNDFPFQNVDSFDACLSKCDDLNAASNSIICLAALFVPSRQGSTNDCYLKNSVADPTQSTFQILGALRLVAGQDSFSSSTTLSTLIGTSASTPATTGDTQTTTSVPVSSASLYITTSSTTPPIPTITLAPGSGPGITFASGNQIIVPKVEGSTLHGPSVNTPTSQYINYNSPRGLSLKSNLLTVGVNGDLTTGYDISLQTGILAVNITTQSLLANLVDTPHLSRDGGQGGMLNGQHIFMFCDSGAYTPATATANGNFLGFVSSSVAVDVGMNGLFGKPLHLQDGIGQWADENGRLRGFSPLTEGEQAYNQVVQGRGQRYAVWPESAIIPLDSTSGIIYAPIVYDDVDRTTNQAVFTYTGATLLTITASGKGGPIAERTVNKIFDEGEVEWGCSGGIRSWGPSGVGGMDGSVYIFGNINGGLLIGRTSPSMIADRDSFEYWDGGSWTKDMQPASSTAFFIQGPFMDLTVFYSPRHLTFIIVYLTAYADNTFYYRYLEADQGILPPFAPGGDSESDHVENLVKYKWSDQQILYKAAPGLSGKYIYAGAVHEGYYGSNDITNGGSRMLISWTAPTGQDPASLNSEYQIVTAEIDWE